ncbi:MAG: signal peptide peptidase SppA [Bacteroidota bacterium]
MKFFQSFLASLLAVIVGILVGIPLIFIVLGGILAGIASGGDDVTVPSESVLHMKLEAPIVEHTSTNPFDDLFGDVPTFGQSVVDMGLHDVVKSIEHAAEDEKIKGIYLNLNMTVQTGWANLSTIREALIDFKSTGKFVYAYSEMMDEKAYYVASAADSVFFASRGMMEFNGLASNPTFLKGMLDKLEVTPKVFKVGTFKSAVEPYLRKDMSPANREQTEQYIGSIWNTFLSDVAISRKMDQPALDELANSFILGDGTGAEKSGLVDRAGTEEDVYNAMKAAIGKEPSDKLSLITLKKYMKAPKSENPFSANKIAVVVAEGTISSGKSSSGTAGSESIVKALRKARKDPSVKGIVLRVNSPGGSALASNVISQEIKLCSEKKPIVASMGDVAASGGYYISAPCDKIFAQPNTITGSIGIFAVLWDAVDALETNIGVTFDEVETNPSANIINPFYKLSSGEEDFLQAWTNRGYSDFIGVVQKGRGFADSTSVDNIAQGRVWIGAKAQELKLVDEMGNLYDAIRYVADQAGIGNEYKATFSPEAESPFEDLLGQMGQAYQDKMMAEHPLHKELKAVEGIKKHLPTSGLYMMAQDDFDIK